MRQLVGAAAPPPPSLTNCASAAGPSAVAL
eukprot:COSAG04_NODE_11972_length_677_cov_1.589965_1_plen_29_part_10